MASESDTLPFDTKGKAPVLTVSTQAGRKVSVAKPFTVSKEGFLLKQRKHIPTWNERYFVLQSSSLAYFARKGDAKPRGLFRIRPACSLSDVTTRARSKHKLIYTFAIIWHTSLPSSPDAAKLGTTEHAHTNTIFLASESLTETMEWRKAIEDSIQYSAHETPVSPALVATKELLAGRTETLAANETGDNASQIAAELREDRSDPWRLVASTHGVRILQEQVAAFSLLDHSSAITYIVATLVMIWVLPVSPFLRVLGSLALFAYGYFVKSAPSSIACYKSSVIVDGPKEELVSLLVDVERHKIWDPTVAETRVLSKLSEDSDIIYARLKPERLFGILLLSPRDLCILRHWRTEADGTFVITMKSTLHPECRENYGIVRASLMKGAIVVSQSHDTGMYECPHFMVSRTLQLDPSGAARELVLALGLWRYIEQSLLAVIGLRDAVEQSRFATLNVAKDQAPGEPAALADVAVANNSQTETIAKTSSAIAAASIELPMLPSNLSTDFWTEPPPSSFKVRGATYLQDKKKVVADFFLFKLCGIDIFTTDGPTEHMASYNDSAFQKQLKVYREQGHSEDQIPFTFIVNLIVPGSPYFAVSFYFCSPDPAKFRGSSDSASELLMDFFESDDYYRNSRFKLIPYIVEGNILVRQSVGSTPALIGKKLRQPYFRGKHYFEVDIDIDSDSIARNVVSIAYSYAKKLVVDIGFVLEAQSEEELPERLLGAVRLRRLDFTGMPKLNSTDRADAESTGK